MTWIIFDNAHVWKLLYVIFISQTLEEAQTTAKLGA